ncbi:MAG: hypothetical protein GY870_02265, partial [archaeon]|nr:hypothetical protein [archaeon]
EVKVCINSIIKHVNKDFIDKINNDVMPQLAKAKFGENIFTFQEESINRIGIDVSLLKWKKSTGAGEEGGVAGDFLDFHRGKEHEMLMSFNTSMDKIRNYLNDKAVEESYSKEIIEKRFKKISKFFNEFEWRWARGRTRSELPLLNAIGVPIIEEINQADESLKSLMNALMTITNKDRASAFKMPVISGLKRDDYPISKPVQEFVNQMEKIQLELTSLNTMNKKLSTLSGYLRLIHPNLPFEYIKNPVFLKDPIKFNEQLDQYEKDIKARKISLTIYEQEYDEKMSTLKKIREFLEHCGDLQLNCDRLVLLKDE